MSDLEASVTVHGEQLSMENMEINRGMFSMDTTVFYEANGLAINKVARSEVRVEITPTGGYLTDVDYVVTIDGVKRHLRGKAEIRSLVLAFDGSPHWEVD